MKRMMFLVVAVIAGAAVAQDAPTFPVVNLDRQALNVTGNGSLLVGNGETVSAGSLRATFALQYANQLAITRRLERNDTVAMDRMYAQIGAAYGISKDWDVSVYLPVVLAQEYGFRGSALGSPIFSVHAGIAEGTYDFVPLDVSFEASAVLELGSPIMDPAALTSSLDPRPHPIFRLNVGKKFGLVNVFAEANFIENTDTWLVAIRGDPRDRTTDSFGTGLGISAKIWEGLSLELSGVSAYDLKEHGFSLQTLAGAKYTASGWNYFVAFGPAFGDLIGTANWRAFGGVSAGFDGLSLPGMK